MVPVLFPKRARQRKRDLTEAKSRQVIAERRKAGRLQDGNLLSIEFTKRREIDRLIPTIFHQPWWLEIATRGQYGVAETKHNGRVVGRMPYSIERRLGGTISTMPMLTHFLGPAIDEGDGSESTRSLRRLTITRDLLARLPRFSYFKQNLYRDVTDVLAFQIEGYDSSVQFTHEIAPQGDETIWDAMRDKTRNMVRKGQQNFICDMIDDPEFFTRFYVENLTERRKANYTDIPISQALIAACLARDCGRLYVARQSNGTIAAAMFCVWDEVSSYYLMSTRKQGSGNSATTLLLWNAIRHATRRGLIFDFDGVATAGSVLFYAGFGATIRPRYIVSSAGRVSRFRHAMREVVGDRRSKFC